MDVADAATAPVPVVETKGVLLSDADGDSTPKSKRETSPSPQPRPRVRYGHGFAPVVEDVVEVYTAAGECMKFSTKDITTGDLRYAVAMRRGVPVSQVQLLNEQSEVGDDTPVMVGQLSVAFRRAPEVVPFPEIL